MTPVIRFVCHHCEKTLEAPERIAGRKIRCPNCGGVRQVPAPEGPEDADVRSPRGRGTKLLGAVAVLSCLCVILLGLSGLALLNGGSLRPPDSRRLAAAPAPPLTPEAPQPAGRGPGSDKGPGADRGPKDNPHPGRLVPPRRDNFEWPEFVPPEPGAKQKVRAEEEEGPVIRIPTRPKAAGPAEQPTPPKPPPPSPPPSAEGPPPAFDPNDLGRTVRWAEGLTGRLRADAGNALRQAETAEEIRKTFRPLYTSRVRWSMKVKEIKADGTVHLDGGHKPLILGMTGGGREGLLLLQAGRTIDLRRAKALNPGDEVVVVGTVEEITLKPDYVLLVLRGPREYAERPGQKGKAR